MGFRITTNMMMSTYRHNLMNSTNKLKDSVDTVLTQRNFNSYAEDPAAATHAWRLRRAFYDNQSHAFNNDDTYKRFHSAWTSLGTIKNDLIDATARASAIRGDSDPTGQGRNALGQVLSETAESVIQGMNVQYGDHFLFAGEDGMNVPFSWDGETLLYRGVNVAAGGVPNPATAGEPNWGPRDPNTQLPQLMPETGDNTWENMWIAYYKDQANGGVAGVENPSTAAAPNWGNPDPDNFDIPVDMPKTTTGMTDIEKAWFEHYNDQADLKKLDMMAAEELNVDLGLGMQEDGNGVLIDGSAFNSALPGISMIGYGVDEDGDPKNAALLMIKLGNIFKNCDSDTGDYNPQSDKEVAFRLLDKLNAVNDYVSTQYTEIDTKAKYLLSNQTRLTDQGVTTQEQILGIEQVDLADAITQLSWDQYCYNSALKIGNQLLSQSLIDYMN